MLLSRFSRSLAQSPLVPPDNPPLVNSGAQDIVYLGFFGLVIALAIVIGILSKKIEYALIFATILSAILIALLWFF
jgi:hypothetical protein